MLTCQAESKKERVCARCGAGLVDDDAPREATPLKTSPARDMSPDEIIRNSCRLRKIAAAASGSCPEAAGIREPTGAMSLAAQDAADYQDEESPITATSAISRPVLEQSVVWEAALMELQQRHAAEVSSIQEAFDARAAAMQDDLQVIPSSCTSYADHEASSSPPFQQYQKSKSIDLPHLALHFQQVTSIQLLPQDKLGLLEELQEALAAAEEELSSRQEALLECQDMVAELQNFSEAKQQENASLQTNIQVRLSS